MAHRELAALKACVTATIALISFMVLTGAASAPDGFDPRATAKPILVAELQPDQASGPTATYAALFQASFNGPNRALKQDRARPPVDAMAVSNSFADIRARIAAIRKAKAQGLDPAAIVVATAPVPAPVAPVDATAATAPVAVASLDPELASSALDAIDQAVDAPIPQTMSQKLAYARSDLPVNNVSGTGHDKYGNVVTAKDLNCMAQAIYFEARSESYRGQVAVGQVVMNRLAHPLYPKTICAVVFQNESQRNACQFSFACDGIPERVTEAAAWDQAMQIARGVISGTLYVSEVGYATHYHATYVYPAWAPRMTKVTKIGMHVFYQFRRGWRFG